MSVEAMPRFGTDGVRGDARTYLTEEAVQALGRIGAEVLGPSGFAVGRDPRVSGPALAGALIRGVEAAGGVPVDLGVLPTPVVARWCADEGVAGAMVSASHNPWHDNGIKFFAVGGRKLCDAVQAEIERRLTGLSVAPAGQRATLSKGVRVSSDESQRRGRGQSATGRSPSSMQVLSAGYQQWIHAGELAVHRHINAVIDSLDGRSLAGMHIVMDCANGAASEMGPECLRRLGAVVTAIHVDPDGRNINNGCGSLHPESLQTAVTASCADAGVAFDGDADRVLAVDHAGALVDGDQILAVCAVDRCRRSRLDGDGVVVTVMANLGLRRAMACHGIAVVETAVGDRHVLDGLAEHGLVLGGEQSGHLIFADLATTGDGLLTAVQLLDAVKRSGRSLAELAASAMVKLPQVLVSVPVAECVPFDVCEDALSRIAEVASDRLGDQGRVLVRRSGTEPVVRVMVEAGDDITARVAADRVAAEVAAVMDEHL